MSYNLLLVGCGNMASAMLSGWLQAGLVTSAVVVKPTPLVDDLANVTWMPTEQGAPAAFAPDLVVLGVKPQMLNDVLPQYRRYAETVPFLSIAAGKTLAYLQEQLGPDATIIRAMPNLPATLRKGVTGCTANAAVTPEQREMVTALLQAVGSVHWIEEAQMDALTALAGSGPAYLFLMVEVLAKAAETLGLSHQLSTILARETIIGAAALLKSSPEDAATLRARVTSKAGVTEAAVNVLLANDALPGLFTAALAANVKRAEELRAV